MVSPRRNVHLVYSADSIMMQFRSVELAIRLGGGFDGRCIWWSQSEGGEHWSNDESEFLRWHRSKKQGRFSWISLKFVDSDLTVIRTEFILEVAHRSRDVSWNWLSIMWWGFLSCGGIWIIFYTEYEYTFYTCNRTFCIGNKIKKWHGTTFLPSTV